MSAIVFLGDESYASAFRLIGVDARPVRRGEEAEDFAAARAAAQQLLLIDARTAERIPADCLDAALAAVEPLVLVLPTGAGTPHDPAEAARRLLGMSADGLANPPRRAS